jgi:lipase
MTYDLGHVPVDGGGLATGTWGEAGPVVLGLHGITSHHRSWPVVAGALPEVRFVAPDVRGRGGSRGLGGPWGMAAHADDAAAVIRAHAPSGEPVVVVGHSMGAFVALVLAHRHPGLVRHLVLVDGGRPFAPAELATTRAALALIRERLETTYDSVDAYVELFRHHPALTSDAGPVVDEYARYDTREVEDGVRAAASVEGVLADQEDILDGEALPAALESLAHPATFLHATRGFADDPAGLYGPDALAGVRERFPDLDVRPVDDVNHYTIVLAERGAAAVAAAVRDALA